MLSAVSTKLGTAAGEVAVVMFGKCHRKSRASGPDALSLINVASARKQSNGQLSLDSALEHPTVFLLSMRLIGVCTQPQLFLW